MAPLMQPGRPEAGSLASPATGRNPTPPFEQAFRKIDDALWKDPGCTSELDYTEQTSWILFLKYLDDLETVKQMEPELRARSTRPSSLQGPAPQAPFHGNAKDGSSTSTTYALEEPIISDRFDQ